MASPSTTLLCVVCLEPVCGRRPVRLPCKCASLMCFDDFNTFMTAYSACPICRERIVPRLRRLLNGKPLESLIDDTLAPQEIASSSISEDNDDANMARRRVPTIPGELAKEVEIMYEKFKSEREMEERASLEYLDADEDLQLLKADEALALQLSAAAATDPACVNVTRPTNHHSIIDLTTQDTSVVNATENVPSVKRARIQWTCAACTFAENSEMKLRCELCNKLKVDPIDRVISTQMQLHEQIIIMSSSQ